MVSVTAARSQVVSQPLTIENQVLEAHTRTKPHDRGLTFKWASLCLINLLMRPPYGGHHIIGTCVVCNWWSRQMDLLEMTAVTLRWSGKALDFTGDLIPITSSKRYFCLPTQFSPYLELVWMYVTPTSLGKPSKKKFFGEGKFSQMWVGGWLVPKQRPVVQTPQNPPNHPERLF